MAKIRFSLLLVFVVCVPGNLHAEEPQNIPVERLGESYRLVGKLQSPLGDVIQVEGVVVEGPFKGYEGGPNLHPQRIQGHATQRDIQIALSPYFNDWGKEALAGGHALPKLEMGKTYQLEGFETGGYVGIPGQAYEKAGIAIQTASHYFRTQFIVYKAKLIEPLRLTPADFQGRHALMQGIARTQDNQSVMEGDGWSVIVDRKAAWPSHVEGKSIETFGMYNPLESPKDAVAKHGRFELADGTWRLVRLEDQLGRAVALRGTARSSNGFWWFRYRGVDLYVENLDRLPGWTTANHWHTMVIRGTLEKAKLPRLDQISLKSERDLKEYYIVRKASWEPLPELLGPERLIQEEE